MAEDKRIATLEEELKLMKGEVKQSLAGVRDYLLNMELPSSEFATVLAALGGVDGEQRITMKGSFANEAPSGAGKEEIEETETESLEEEGPEAGSPDEGEATEEFTEDGDELENPENEAIAEDLPGEDEEYPEAEDGLTPREEPGEANSPGDENITGPEADSSAKANLPADEGEYMECRDIAAEANRSTPKVNLLANLISWVARAKREIGSEQLATFLEVYGISGHLSPELKETILNLAEITSEAEGGTGTAATWGQAMLSLHGILTGGEAPLYPVRPDWHSNGNEAEVENEEIIEVDKPSEEPVKLKLVFPGGNGRSREFCVNLSPEPEMEDDEDS